MSERSERMEITSTDLLADLIEFTDGHVGNAMNAIRTCIREGKYDSVLSILGLLDINRRSVLQKANVELTHGADSNYTKGNQT